MKKATLTILGCGIKFLSHLTIEAKAYIEKADKVFYLVNDPAMKQWIQKAARESESLDPLYTKYPLRIKCYEAITEHLMNNLRNTELHLCSVFYGHPSVFSQPGLNTALKAKEEGFEVKVLPGVSAEDCLFADLLIDPGMYGCQSFEATDFLINRRKFDPHSHLILWQIDIIGVLNNPQVHDNHHGATVLVNHLKQYYNPSHEIVLYEAAQYPFFEPKIQRVKLINLPNAIFSRISTLYIPPVNQVRSDEEMLRVLNIQHY